jgi:hypothetical protein
MFVCVNNDGCMCQYHNTWQFEYEVHKYFLNYFNLEKNPKMHWIDTSSWDMVQHMHDIIFEATKFVGGTTQYLSFIYDEVSIIDNQN